MVLAVLLDTLLRTCASAVGTKTMTAIVRVESGGDPLALHDNTLGRSFAPPDRRTAVAWADQLMGLGYSVDLGLSQINGANLAPLGLTTAKAFEPCANLHGGATILEGDYLRAVSTFGPGQVALRHAIGAYNTGSIFAGASYLDRILAAAGYPAPAFAEPALVPIDAARPLRDGAPTTAASLAAPAVRPAGRVADAPGWTRAKAPAVAHFVDAAEPQMIVVRAAGAAAAKTPVVLVGR